MIKNLHNLFFPEFCLACSKYLLDNESEICTSCRHELPTTGFHHIKNNPFEKVFYGRVKIEHATALFFFQKKGSVQQLLHNLKYRGHERIGTLLGKWLGHELSQSDYYNAIDLIIPVPLHKARLRQRGYNQVEKFAQEIAVSLGVQYHSNILIKTSSTSTQVFKKRLERLNSSKASFKVINADILAGKHILLVDDIITTGATIEACANQLFTANFNKNLKISVATMAIAQ
ncbi:MAG: ComF family protein [Flavobacteriaceae bacterium]|nr:ComF family protein [Flavobacteriaceae bacterium]